jgi:putative PIN family toxin of toxin-antitoxin system
LRFIFDTNVIVSALLLEESTSRRAFNLALERGKILLSFPVLAELKEVLGRQQFRRYVEEDEVRRFISALVHEAEWVEARMQIVASRDPKDDKFLELALSGQATHIISGDKDLLTLSPFQGTPILTPDAFLETVR